MDGLFLVNKPAGLTSTAVSNRIKWLLKQATGQKRIKVGHGGTLDPFATGVLPIAVGKATKLLQRLLDAPKTYTFTLQFGTATTTGDRTGEIVAVNECYPTARAMKAAIPRFVGEIMQTPPAYSAIKVGGRRAYALARAGEDVKLDPRPVTIYGLTLMQAGPTWAEFRARVSKGTYIRTLGEDLAKALGTVGHLTALCRVEHGPFQLADTVDLLPLTEALQTGGEGAYLRTLDDLALILGR